MFSWTRTETTPGDGRTTPPGVTHVPEPTPPPSTPTGAAPAEPAPARRFTDATPPCATRLGRLQIRGTLTGTDSVELGGVFDGPVTLDGLCHVAEGGRVNGTITAEDAVIAGEVHGQVTVRGRLEMRAHSRVLADVEAKTVAIAEGCFIEGRIHMRGGDGAPAEASQPTSFQEKRKDRKKARRAAAAAAAAHEAPSEAAGPEPASLRADGDMEPPAES